MLQFLGSQRVGHNLATKQQKKLIKPSLFEELGKLVFIYFSLSNPKITPFETVFQDILKIPGKGGNELINEMLNWLIANLLCLQFYRDDN